MTTPFLTRVASPILVNLNAKLRLARPDNSMTIRRRAKVAERDVRQPRMNGYCKELGFAHERAKDRRGRQGGNETRRPSGAHNSTTNRH